MNRLLGPFFSSWFLTPCILISGLADPENPLTCKKLYWGNRTRGVITFRLCFFQILGLLIVVELAITLTSRVEMPRGKITVKFLHLCKGCVMMYTRWYQHDWNTSRSSLKKLRNNFFFFHKADISNDRTNLVLPPTDDIHFSFYHIMSVYNHSYYQSDSSAYIR